MWNVSTPKQREELRYEVSTRDDDVAISLEVEWEGDEVPEDRDLYHLHDLLQFQLPATNHVVARAQPLIARAVKEIVKKFLYRKAGGIQV